MFTGILAVLSAFFAAIPALLNVLEGRKVRAHDRQHALAQVEVDELDRGMRAVDDELRPRP